MIFDTKINKTNNKQIYIQTKHNLISGKHSTRRWFSIQNTPCIQFVYILLGGGGWRVTRFSVFFKTISHYNWIQHKGGGFSVPCRCFITETDTNALVNKLTVTFTSSAAIQIGDRRAPRRRQAGYGVRFTSTSIGRLSQPLEKHLCWKVNLFIN